MTSRGAGRLDDVAAAMLEATEEIHAGLLGAGDVESIAPAYDRRERLFTELQAATEQGGVLSARGRTYIDRVRSLDQEILSIGSQQTDAIRGERYGILRRRSAIQAHASREREEPRLVTLKA